MTQTDLALWRRVFARLQQQRHRAFVAGRWAGSLADLAALLDTDELTAARVAACYAPRGTDTSPWVAAIAERYGLAAARVRALAARIA